MIRRVVSEMHDLESGMTFRNTAQALPGLILASAPIHAEAEISTGPNCRQDLSAQ